MLLILYIPSANNEHCIKIYTIFTCHILLLIRSDSNLEKTEFVCRMPLIGFENSWHYRSGLCAFNRGGALLTI